MNDCEQFSRPQLIVVTGRPGAGKSTLAHQLARAVRCPLISRDEIKEGLVNTLRDTPHDIDLNRHVYHTYFDVLEFLLRQRITLVTEVAFQHKLWQPKLDPLRAIADIKIVYCEVNGEVAKSRFIERGQRDPARAKFHDNMSIRHDTDISNTSLANYTPPQLDVPTLTVDTSDGYQPTMAEIVSFLAMSD